MDVEQYSNVPNKRAYTFISGKLCLLGSIKVKRPTLPEINVHGASLFGALEQETCTLCNYVISIGTDYTFLEYNIFNLF